MPNTNPRMADFSHREVEDLRLGIGNVVSVLRHRIDACVSEPNEEGVRAAKDMVGLSINALTVNTLHALSEDLTPGSSPSLLVAEWVPDNELAPDDDDLDTKGIRLFVHASRFNRRIVSQALSVVESVLVTERPERYRRTLALVAKLNEGGAVYG